ncbi:MAG: hypothetical protein AAFV53_43150, partial [Myxococcota bacterium]
MPRIIDKLDATIGGTPPDLSDSIDYLTQAPPPAHLVGEDGRYQAGWYTAAPKSLNFSDSAGIGLALQRWIHLCI